MTFKIDDNTHWEDTGRIVMHPSVSAYTCRVYRQYKRGEQGFTIVEGDPIHLWNMTPEQQVLFKIACQAMESLLGQMPREKGLTEM